MSLLQLLTGSTTLDILPTPQPRQACSVLSQTDCGDGLGSSWNSGWWFSSSGLSISANPSSCPALMSCPKAETALLTSQLAWKAWGAITHMLSVLTVPWSFNERCSQFLVLVFFFFFHPDVEPFSPQWDYPVLEFRLSLYHTKTHHARRGLSEWHPALLKGTQPMRSALLRSCVFPLPSEWQLSLPLCDMAQLYRSRDHIQENSKGKGKERYICLIMKDNAGYHRYTPRAESPELARIKTSESMVQI